MADRTLADVDVELIQDWWKLRHAEWQGDDGTREMIQQEISRLLEERWALQSK